MASIWEHPKTVNWIARYRGSAGKTVNRSTGVADKEEALRVAKQWEIEAARERGKQNPEVSAGGISDAVARVERLARQGRLDAAAVRDAINDLLVAAGQQTIDAVTNRAWCDGWKASKKGAVKESSRLKYDQVCRDWLKFLNGRADKPLETVAKVDAIAFRDKLAGEGLSPATVNQTVKLLRGVFNDAVKQGHLGRNPFFGVDGIRQGDDEAKREPFTRAEVQSLISHARGDWKGLVIVAATTGLRLMDAARLQWKQLDLDENVIRIRTQKTGTVLTLPIHSTFGSWLKKQTRGIGAAHVFPSLAQKAGSGKSGLSLGFKRLMEAANIEAGVLRQADDESRGRTTCKKSFHSLRHFAATQLAANGVRAEVARQITGHADAETHANYVTADLDSLRIAVKNIRLTA
jgi:integrase